MEAALLGGPPPSERRVQLKRYVEAELAAIRPYIYLTRAFAAASVIAVIAFIYAGIDNNAFSSVLFFQLENDYGAVVDAGSHGSRLHLYQWPARIHDPDHPLSGPVSIPVEIFSLRAEPGISATVDDGGDPSRAGELCIGPLLDQLKIVLLKLRVDQDKWSDIPVFVKATAGMRDLDSASRSAIMNSIREYIANETPFLFHWSWARITAGEEEGVYGWLTVNSALGTLLMPAGETFGAMDLGGASMQITYAPLRTSVLESYYGLSLGGQAIHLYSHSFLGYGWGDSMTRLTTRLAVEAVVETLQAEGFDELHFAALQEYLMKQYEALADATADLIFPPTLSPTRKLQRVDSRIISPPRAISPVANDTVVVGKDGDKVYIPPQGPRVASPSETTAPPDDTDEEGGDDDVGAPHPPGPADADKGKPLLVHVRATHPCYPTGHSFQYYLPTITLPEGRLFLDVDLAMLVTFMRLSGLSEDVIRELVEPKIPDPVGGNGDAQMEQIINRAAQRQARGEVPFGSLPNRQLLQQTEEEDTEEKELAARNMREERAKRHAVDYEDDVDKDDDAIPIYRETRAATRRNAVKKSPPSALRSAEGALRRYNAAVLQWNARALLLDERDPLHYADPDDDGDSYGGEKSWFNPAHVPGSEFAEGGKNDDINNDSNSSSPGLRKLQNVTDAPGDSDHRESLFAHDAGPPFRPLTEQLPPGVAPLVQYVIDFEGSSDPETCRQRARDLFYQQPCFVHSCSFNGIYMPAKDGSQFIAFGQFSRVQQALNTTANVSPAAIATASDEVCRSSKQQLQAAHATGRYLPYGKNGVLLLCWKSLWTYTVLNWAYGFPGNSSQITFAQTVGDGPNQRAVGWSDGSMIVEVNNFPWKTPLGRFEVPFLLASAVALLFAATTWLVLVQLRSRGRIIRLAGLDGVAHSKKRRPSGERRLSDVPAVADAGAAYIEA